MLEEQGSVRGKRGMQACNPKQRRQEEPAYHPTAPRARAEGQKSGRTGGTDSGVAGVRGKRGHAPHAENKPQPHSRLYLEGTGPRALGALGGLTMGGSGEGQRGRACTHIPQNQTDLGLRNGSWEASNGPRELSWGRQGL